MMRALLIGAGLALVVVMVGIALVASGVVSVDGNAAVPDRVLVVATSPDEEGVEVASMAFVLEREGASALVLDTQTTVAIPGTSAQNVRDAYPFIGGAGAAEALAEQTGGEQLPWVVLPSSVWGPVVDEGDGLELDVPHGVSAYNDGRLVMLESGKRTLASADIVALLSSLDYVDDGEKRLATARQAATGLSALFSADVQRLVKSHESSGASSSLSREEIEEFAAE